jgi:hypothetical protein
MGREGKPTWAPIVRRLTRRKQAFAILSATQAFYRFGNAAAALLDLGDAGRHG